MEQYRICMHILFLLQPTKSKGVNMNTNMNRLMNSKSLAVVISAALSILTACAPSNSNFESNAEIETSQTSNEYGIIGGQSANPSSIITKHVLMLASVGKKGELSICSATMISNKHVLTAAHCADSKNSTMYAVYSNEALNRFRIMMNSPGLSSDPRIVRIDKVAIHPLWDGSIGNKAKRDGDLAILSLSKPAPPDFKVTKIAQTYPSVGNHLLAAGFGNEYGYLKSGSGELRSVRIPISGYEPGKIIVNHKSGTYGICNGDSGGPAFIQNLESGELVQIGISSYVSGNKLNYCEDRGYFTYVLHYSDWINQVIQYL